MRTERSLVALLTATLLIGCAAALQPTPKERSAQFVAVNSCAGCATPTPTPWTPVFTPDPYNLPSVTEITSTGAYSTVKNCSAAPWPGGVLLTCTSVTGVKTTTYMPQYPVNFPPPPMHPHCWLVGIGAGKTSWYGISTVLAGLKIGSIAIGNGGEAIWIGGSTLWAVYYGC